MASTNYTPQRVVAILAGAGLVGYSAHLTFDHSGEIAAPIAAVVGAGLFHFAETCIRQRKWLTFLSFGFLAILAVAISLSMVIAREATRYDSTTQARASENVARDQAKQALADAEAARDRAQAAVREEAKDGGCKRICQGFKKIAAEAQARVDEERSALAKMGAATVVDPGAVRIAWLFNVTEAEMAMLKPLMLPIWLELAGIALLTFGLSAPKRREAQVLDVQPIAVVEPTSEAPAVKALPEPKPARVRIPAEKKGKRAKAKEPKSKRVRIQRKEPPPNVVKFETRKLIAANDR